MAAEKPKHKKELKDLEEQVEKAKEIMRIYAKKEMTGQLSSHAQAYLDEYHKDDKE